MYKSAEGTPKKFTNKNNVDSLHSTTLYYLMVGLVPFHETLYHLMVAEGLISMRILTNIHTLHLTLSTEHKVDTGQSYNGTYKTLFGYKSTKFNPMICDILFIYRTGNITDHNDFNLQVIL